MWLKTLLVQHYDINDNNQLFRLMLLSTVSHCHNRSINQFRSDCSLQILTQPKKAASYFVYLKHFRLRIVKLSSLSHQILS